MGTGKSDHFNGTKGARTKLHVGRQEKHIIGHNNYIEGKSIFTGTLEEAQHLISEFSGTGTRLGSNRERVDFGRVIGYYVDQKTKQKYLTTMGLIHYSKTGAHIVPSKPKEEE